MTIRVRDCSGATSRYVISPRARGEQQENGKLAGLGQIRIVKVACGNAAATRETRRPATPPRAVTSGQGAKPHHSNMPGDRAGPEHGKHPNRRTGSAPGASEPADPRRPLRTRPPIARRAGFRVPPRSAIDSRPGATGQTVCMLPVRPSTVVVVPLALNTIRSRNPSPLMSEASARTRTGETVEHHRGRRQEQDQVTVPVPGQVYEQSGRAGRQHEDRGPAREPRRARPGCCRRLGRR